MSALREVTYREFSRLGKKRGWTIDMLVELFKGRIGVDDSTDGFRENLKSYFERVISCRWLNPETRRMEDRGGNMIGHRSVIEFYEREFYAAGGLESQSSFGDLAARSPLSARACACGCGARVFGKKIYATPACRKRAQRARGCHSGNMVTDAVFEG